MLKTIVALFAGALFGTGLVVSGMADPRKVIGFLDVAGDWDPTLAFAMGGALLVTGPAFRLILKRPRPVLAGGFDLPTKNTVDRRLIGGAALFGVGWGLRVLPGPRCGCPFYRSNAGAGLRGCNAGRNGHSRPNLRQSRCSYECRPREYRPCIIDLSR